MSSSVKYVLVTGGVLSGLGKGVIASSTGRLLRSHGFHVTSIKIDPYINVDAGTMSPFEHGEVFVLDDGGEVDLDLGNYERFVDITLRRDNNITTGRVYNHVIERERRGDYLGKTVQVVPHICDEIQEWVQRVAMQPVDGSNDPPEVCIIELGGTVGDIESMPFIEAMRQFQFRVGKESFCLIHVSLVPVIGVVGEQKTKPTQQTVRELRALGLSPDIIMCRSASELEISTKQKISSFCHVPPKCVLGVHDVSNIYKVPQMLYNQGLLDLLVGILKLPSKASKDYEQWNEIAVVADRLKTGGKPIHIAFVGKYIGLTDSYLSVIRALQHASFYVHVNLVIDWIESEDLEDNSREKYDSSWALLRGANGILVPGGFGDRGVAGKILAARFARENRIPYLGICLGLQIAVIEYARSVLGWSDANSEEFNPKSNHLVVVSMPEVSKSQYGGTMRLGARKTILNDPQSISFQLYRLLGAYLASSGTSTDVMERHRHRYEVNPTVVGALSKAGMRFVGRDESGGRQEVIELPDHPFYLGVQYHPEMKSRPNRPSPPFVGLMLSASGHLSEWMSNGGKLPLFK